MEYLINSSKLLSLVPVAHCNYEPYNDEELPTLTLNRLTSVSEKFINVNGTIVNIDHISEITHTNECFNIKIPSMNTHNTGKNFAIIPQLHIQTVCKKDTPELYQQFLKFRDSLKTITNL